MLGTPVDVPGRDDDEGAWVRPVALGRLRDAAGLGLLQMDGQTPVIEEGLRLMVARAVRATMLRIHATA